MQCNVQVYNVRIPVFAGRPTATKAFGAVSVAAGPLLLTQRGGRSHGFPRGLAASWRASAAHAVAAAGELHQRDSAESAWRGLQTEFNRPRSDMAGGQNRFGTILG